MLLSQVFHLFIKLQPLQIAGGGELEGCGATLPPVQSILCLHNESVPLYGQPETHWEMWNE